MTLTRKQKVQITSKIKETMIQKVRESEGDVSPRITFVKFDGYFLSTGKFVLKSASGIATFTDYRMGENGAESYKRKMEVAI